MALRRALPRWDRHGQSTSSQEILASLKALLLCDYDVTQFSDLPSHSLPSLNFRAKNVAKSLKIHLKNWFLKGFGISNYFIIGFRLIPIGSGMTIT